LKTPIPSKNGSRIGKRGSEGLEMVQKCYFCKGRVNKDQVTIDYRWGGTLVVIKSVPAGVCQQCGEKYIDSAVYKGLEELAKTKGHLLGRMRVLLGSNL
jgi:YgiT-type zinc finger domain-containing protein